MNILQGLPAGSPLFCVTLNPDAPVDERFVLQRFVYEHPLFNPQSWRAQARRGEINGHQRSWFCGPTGTTVFMKMACAARWTWSTRSRPERGTEMNSCLYHGVLRHRRLQPKTHEFRYSVFMAWLDLDELPLLASSACAAIALPPPRSMTRTIRSARRSKRTCSAGWRA
jgi:hypothetical protein